MQKWPAYRGWWCIFSISLFLSNNQPEKCSSLLFKYYLVLFSDGYMHSFVSDGGSTASSSESEFEPGYASKAKKKKKKHKDASRGFDSPSDYLRTTGRSKGVVSYKDFYGSDVNESGEEGEEGVEDLGEGGAVPLVEDNRETIEKILKKRIGKVGGENYN